MCSINEYRLTKIDEEPSDEMLQTIMKEAAEDAKIRGEKAYQKLLEAIRQQSVISAQYVASKLAH